MDQLDDDDFDAYAAGRAVIPEKESIGKRELVLPTPWLKPRKQQVRRAWLHQIRHLIRKLRSPLGEGAPIFRYLTLPGEDLLDVRCLRPAAREHGYKVKYVGFNSSNRGTDRERRLTLAQNQLRSEIEWVHEGSTILWHRLEEIAHGDKPIAYTKAEKLGPYHAINFDLCGDLAYRDSPGATPLDALSRLVKMQTARCSHSWLLFVTTRVEKRRVAKECLSSFLAAIDSNFRGSNEFAVALDNLVSKHGVTSHTALTKPDTLSDEAFRDLFCLGLSKWLLGLLAASSPPFFLRMQPSFYYSVTGERPDMLSLCFLCESGQRAGVDPTGLTVSGSDNYDPQSEIALGLEALEKTVDLQDLDRTLAENPERASALAIETAELLRAASYHEGEIHRYLEWATCPSAGQPA